MAKDKPRKALQELLQRPGNQLCADCSAPDPDWASHSLGVFICLSCSGIHRNIPQVSKVKSVRLDSWDDAQVEFMAANGNNVAKAKYESKIPPFYYKPTFPDCQLLREQWIRAKYERKEFIYTEKQEPYSAGSERNSQQLIFAVYKSIHFLSVVFFSITLKNYISLDRKESAPLWDATPLGVWIQTLESDPKPGEINGGGHFTDFRGFWAMPVTNI